DGCITEATAAAIAADEAAAAGTLSVRNAQRAIAADEARHAELGWAILEWAAAVDPQSVRPALRGALAARTDATLSPVGAEGDGGARAALAGLTAFGIAGAGRVGAIAAREESHARQRLRTRLAS